jgi:hypothetical protein
MSQLIDGGAGVLDVGSEEVAEGVEAEPVRPVDVDRHDAVCAVPLG